MKVIVTTESGSKYILDPRLSTFRRENTRGLSGAPERTWLTGQLLLFPEIWIGEPMYLNVRVDGRETTMRTTPVTNFENVEV